MSIGGQHVKECWRQPLLPIMVEGQHPQTRPCDFLVAYLMATIYAFALLLSPYLNLTSARNG